MSKPLPRNTKGLAKEPGISLHEPAMDQSVNNIHSRAETPNHPRIFYNEKARDFFADTAGYE